MVFIGEGRGRFSFIIVFDFFENEDFRVIRGLKRR